MLSEPGNKVLNLDTNMSSNFTKDSPMSKCRIIKNLLVLCLGFLFLFSAFMALTNLQSTMNNTGSVGVASQSAIYSTAIVSGLFLPTLVIKRFGCKLTLILGMLTYSPYIAANLYPTMLTLLPTAILNGAGGVNLWTASSGYINELSFMDAREDAAKASLSTSTFFGIFNMCFQTTQIWGNLVSYSLLTPSSIASDNSQNTSTSEIRKFFMEISNISCGAEFCGGIDQKLAPLSISERYTLISIFFALSLIAAAVLLFFLDPLKQDNGDKEDSSVFQKLAATMNHMKKIDQLLLIIPSIFVGLEQGFVFADYSEAFVACAMGLQNVGLVFVCFGIVSSATAVIVGRLLKYVPRAALLITAAASNIGVCTTLLYWKPDSQQVFIFYILVGFWGFSDAIWQTQMCALYGVLFRNDEEAAFACFKLCDAVGFLIAFSCSSYLCISSKIYIVVGFLLTGTAGYIALEIRTFMKSKSGKLPVIQANVFHLS